MSEKDIETLVYERLCKHCYAKNQCAEQQDRCTIYKNQIREGENYANKH